MFFDPKVTFNEVSVRRENKEGRYLPESTLFSINFDKIDSYSSGVLKLGNGEVITVEEDHDTIRAIMQAKLEEHAKYEQRFRLAEKLGVDPEEVVL